MKIWFEIKNLPYMPLNRAKMIARNMLIKTALCRDFEKDIQERLKEFSETFKTFKTYFTSGNYYIHVVYELHCPKNQLFTKDGKISSRSPDADSIKVLQDNVFKSLGIDDKFAKRIEIIMVPSEDDNWNYKIYLTALPVSILHD